MKELDGETQCFAYFEYLRPRWTMSTFAQPAVERLLAQLEHQPWASAEGV
jgi:hypothetical protein